MVSKLPFTSGILGFGEFCFCSFAAHLKTIPFPFQSTRGRYDPCFGPATPPPTPASPSSSLRDLITKIQCLPFGEDRWKKTLYKLFLELQLTRGLHIYCSFDLTSVPCARCSPLISQAGEPRLTVLKGCVSSYVDFQWWTWDLISSSPLIPLVILH